MKNEIKCTLKFATGIKYEYMRRRIHTIYRGSFDRFIYIIRVNTNL